MYFVLAMKAIMRTHMPYYLASVALFLRDGIFSCNNKAVYIEKTALEILL